MVGGTRRTSSAGGAPDVVRPGGTFARVADRSTRCTETPGWTRCAEGRVEVETECACSAGTARAPAPGRVRPRVAGHTAKVGEVTTRAGRAPRDLQGTGARAAIPGPRPANVCLSTSKAEQEHQERQARSTHRGHAVGGTSLCWVPAQVSFLCDTFFGTHHR